MNRFSRLLLPILGAFIGATVITWAQTRSIQLNQDNRGPILYDQSTQATTFPKGGLSSAYVSSSATPGTVRNVLGKVSVGPTAITSGNLVGARGEVNVPSGATSNGAAAYLYGTQGKFIGGGTVTSANIAGLMGQIDASVGTYTAGVVSALWLDMGSSASASAQSTSFGGASQLLRMTNTTNAGAAKTTSIMDIYANSDLFMTLGAPANTVSYFAAAGTGANSCGLSGGMVAAKVLHITVGGVDYYIPLCSSNSN